MAEVGRWWAVSREGSAVASISVAAGAYRVGYHAGGSDRRCARLLPWRDGMQLPPGERTSSRAASLESSCVSLTHSLVGCDPLGFCLRPPPSARLLAAAYGAPASARRSHCARGQLCGARVRNPQTAQQSRLAQKQAAASTFRSQLREQLLLSHMQALDLTLHINTYLLRLPEHGIYFGQQNPSVGVRKDPRFRSAELHLRSEFRELLDDESYLSPATSNSHSRATRSARKALAHTLHP